MTYKQFTRALGTIIGTLCQASAFLFLAVFLVPALPLIWAMSLLEKKTKKDTTIAL